VTAGVISSTRTGPADIPVPVRFLAQSAHRDGRRIRLLKKGCGVFSGKKHDAPGMPRDPGQRGIHRSRRSYPHQKHRIDAIHARIQGRAK
jgi:hypothetical protein